LKTAVLEYSSHLQDDEDWCVSEELEKEGEEDKKEEEEEESGMP